MVRSVVNLAELDVNGFDDQDSEKEQLSAGAIRSSLRNGRAGRRKSPYGQESHKRTPGLSGPVAGMSISLVSPTGLRSTTGRVLASPSASRSATRRVSEVARVMSKGPIARQEDKEKQWKEKLLRQQTSWWDAARMAHDAGETRCVGSNEHKGPVLKDGQPGSTAEAGSEAYLRTLARGRNHARADVASLEEWRSAMCDDFLGIRPEQNPKPKLLLPVSSELQHSPGHYHRRYGNRSQLQPLARQQKMIIASAHCKRSWREAQNLAARRTAFHLLPAI